MSDERDQVTKVVQAYFGFALLAMVVVGGFVLMTDVLGDYWILLLGAVALIVLFAGAARSAENTDDHAATDGSAE